MCESIARSVSPALLYTLADFQGVSEKFCLNGAVHGNAPPRASSTVDAKADTGSGIDGRIKHLAFAS